MLVKGRPSSAQLQQISIFQDLATTQLESLVPYSYVREYQQDEIVMLEGDRIPQQLHALITGRLEIKKTSANGKETLVRLNQEILDSRKSNHLSKEEYEEYKDGPINIRREILVFLGSIVLIIVRVEGLVYLGLQIGELLRIPAFRY